MWRLCAGVALALLAAGCRGGHKDEVIIDTAEPTLTPSVTPLPPTATATLPATPSHGPGTLVGKTPTIGYVLICTDGTVTWSQLSLVIHPDWPPSEECK